MSRQRYRLSAVFLLSWIAGVAHGTEVDPSVLNACPGYRATDVKTQDNGLTAQLQLAGTACNVFGSDLLSLSLNVVYETNDRIHVKITDATSQRYEVPDSVFPRPSAAHGVTSKSANIQFEYTTSPFEFTIKRSKTGEVLFTTAENPIIFEPQYLRVKTSLPNNPNIYGLGEHTDLFRLPPENTTRTLWSRDAYGIPPGTNLYGNHPIYYEHRTTGTHGVLLLSSNGMDIKLRNDASGYSLEYNVIGGVLDFYFLAGSTSDPVEVARQYAQVAGLPAEVPYWSFGLHQCRFGYKDYIDVAGVITNYSAAGIPLETMWTDIDYMDRRRIFTVDPVYFPMDRMREIVQFLHSHNQHFVLMTDPAVGVITDNYGPYTRGTALDIWLKAANGSDELGLVWPGVTVYPDWFHPKIAEYWNGEFQSFYSPETGLDIDGAWIDMNEPSSFCNLPCDDPWAQAVQQDLPPARTNPPPPPDAPIFTGQAMLGKRDAPAVDLLDPPYKINNAAPGGQLSSKTASSNAKHANGLVEYDTHNLYGTMMSVATRDAMLSRRPGKRTLVITRSTFAGAGAHVGKWLGDNMALWEHYRFSIAGMLGFASVYQLPMVGSDICGYAGNTTENLCARWATLGSFYPFMRNHNDDVSISQEFYRWPSVAAAARNGIDMRYRLLDYIYTAFHQAHIDGTPVLNPLWFKYPKDQATYGIDLQFFFGDSILVSPVTDQDSTSVTIYLPKDIFYDFKTLAPIQGQGSTVQLSNVNFTEIPVHIKGGAVVPLRAKSQMTTAELRKTDFDLVVAPGTDGTASGQLYFDDGESIENPTSTNVKFAFQKQKLTVSGSFGFPLGVKVASVKFLNVHKAPGTVRTDRGTLHSSQFSYDPKSLVFTMNTALDFTHGFSLQYT